MFTNPEIAKATNCNTCFIKAIRLNIHYFSIIKAPPNDNGRKRSIIPLILDALYKHLLEKPELYRSKIIVFLYDKFEILVTTFNIRRVLAFKG